MPRKIKGKAATEAEDDERFRERYPNLAAQEDLDRAEHVKAAVAMGTPKSVAERHAAEEAGRH
jgi:hypothetical protein